jgi:exopolyphosphatase/guanosine-5'-triphosphate,3'-diphosphate pyrophosphatase
MEKIGVIDIGSNSVRLVIAEVHEGKAFRIIYEVKESARLAMDITEDGNLNKARVDAAIETLKLFKDVCEGFHVNKIIAVATAAVRSATNQKEFLHRSREEAGIEITVLSGVEEAYYDYFGIINSMDISDAVIMDIGGASTELILVKDRAFKEALSLPFGAITLSNKFNLLDEPNKEIQKQLNEYLLHSFEGVSWLEEAKNLPLVGVGGTIRNLGKIDRKKKEYPLEITHNYPLEAEDVFQIFDSVKDMNLKQRKKVKGLSKDRADIFLGALSEVECLIKYCSCPKLFVSGSGVREGLIYEYLLNSKKPTYDVLEFSLNSLMYFHGISMVHSKEVWTLSNNLFEQLQPLHSLDSSLLNILKTSSLLHNIGISVDYYSRSEHSFYTILNSKINGLTPKEKLMSALAVSILKKDGIQNEVNCYRSILSEEDVITIQKLGLILKISLDLNVRKNNNVKKVDLSILGDTAVIKVICSSKPDIEVEATRNISADFQRLLGKKLIIV